MTHLEWSRIDLVRKTAWVLGEKTKNGKALAVPLSDKALEILQAQKALQEEDETERNEPLR